MDEDRLKHSIGVARKMVEIAKKRNFSEQEIRDCFLIGFNHDIGYEFVEDKALHNRVGGDILRKSGFKFWREVYFHGEVETEYSSVFLDILNQADMQVDKFGNDVGYDKRLDDIGSRYGTESEVYERCKRLVERVRE